MPSVAPAVGAGASGVLLERSAELSTLVGCLEAVERSSRGQVLLVGGEAGVGKTTLLRRFCEGRGQSGRVLWGACDPLFTPSPLGPLLEVAEASGGELKAVVARGAMPYAVVTALAQELRVRVPSVFVLEDVHWADEATLDVLRLLARRVETVPALVVASYRDDELDRAHPLRILLGELARSRTVRRLKPARLSPGAVAQLAAPYGVDADELYRKTAGNPFFVVEALATKGEGIPDTVRDAVLARAARLSPEGGRLLEAVAVVPPQAELWLLEALAGDAADGLDKCLASGMLIAAAAGVAFRHELARLAVEESVPPHRRVELHRRALAALADPPGGAPDLARLAHHAEAAGDVDAVLRFAPAAATRAASLGAYREAAAQYARALRFGDRLPAAECAELLERRSHACYLTDQNDAAVEAIQDALECRRRLGQRLEEGDSLRWLSQILWCPGRTGESEQAARAAVTLLETQPPGRQLAMAYANLARTCAAAARSEEAVHWAGRAFELAERLDDTEIFVEALTTVGTCEPEEEEGRRKLERSLELATRDGLAEHVGRAYVLLVATALGTDATASPPATCKRESTTAATRVWSVTGSTCSPTGRACSSTRAAGRRQATPPRPSFASPAARSRRASKRWWCWGWSGRGAATPASGPRSRRRGRWRSQPGSCRDSGRPRWPEPRPPGSKATARPSPRQPRVSCGSPRSGTGGRWPASWPTGAGAPAWLSFRPRVRSRTCSRPPASGRGRPSDGGSSAARTRPRSRWPMPARRSRCGVPWRSCSGWGRGRPPTPSPGGCGSSACGDCRAVPAGRRRPTRPG